MMFEISNRLKGVVVSLKVIVTFVLLRPFSKSKINFKKYFHYLSCRKPLLVNMDCIELAFNSFFAVELKILWEKKL